MANLGTQGQPLARFAFAANDLLPGVPVDIVKGHGDFPGPQAKPSTQAQHGIIPLAELRRPEQLCSKDSTSWAFNDLISVSTFQWGIVGTEAVRSVAVLLCA